MTTGRNTVQRSVVWPSQVRSVSGDNKISQSFPTVSALKIADSPIEVDPQSPSRCTRPRKPKVGGCLHSHRVLGAGNETLEVIGLVVDVDNSIVN